MAEAILTPLAFGLAIPGIAIELVYLARRMEKITKAFCQSSQAIKHLQLFGQDLHSGQLKLDIELAESTLFSEDPNLRWTQQYLRGCLTELRRLLADSTLILEKCRTSQDSWWGRGRFAISGQWKIEQKLSEFKKWQQNFMSAIDLIVKTKHMVPDNLLLPSNKLKIIQEEHTATYLQIDPQGILYMAEAEYFRGAPCKINVLVERPPSEVREDADETTEMAVYISRRLNANNGKVGILRCLGYRFSPCFELVFEVPNHLHSPRNLRDVIQENKGVLFGGYALEARQLLCKRLCDAVFAVSSSRLVHKNIRPDTIWVFEDSSSGQSDGLYSSQLQNAFLMHWRMLRDVSLVSSREGVEDWKQNIYRHPQRQGVQPEAHYNIGHDIYSLGVTLLEIGLWESFLDPDETLGISATYQHMAVSLGLIQFERSASIRKWTTPINLQKIMIALTKELMPSRMGLGFARFVESCLTCLEGGMDDVDEFKRDNNAAAIRFHELAMQTFSSIAS